MHHYTLNTGHTRTSPRDEVGGDIIERLRPMLAEGTHAIPSTDCTVDITPVGTALVATVRRAEKPLVTFAVAAAAEDAAMLWQNIESLYWEITDMPGFRAAGFQSPRVPASTPWCAVVTLFLRHGDDWLGDFERCLAWAWIDHKRPT